MHSAIIIEFRIHRALSYVLNNFLENLSEEWNFIIFHGNLNAEYVQKIVDTDLINYKSRIKKVQLPYDNLLPHEYSKLLIDETIIYPHIPTEIFLIFQTDSIIIKKNKNNINDFLKYDYVGAPWHGFGGYNDVGNGGLSLRKKSKMLKIIKKDSENRTDLPEDLFFAQTTKVKLHKPSPFEASKFSIENVLHSGEPFGVHKPWLCLRDFCGKHPEIVDLMALQG